MEFVIFGTVLVVVESERDETNGGRFAGATADRDMNAGTGGGADALSGG
jgi:hypothetical protein